MPAFKLVCTRKFLSYLLQFFIRICYAAWKVVKANPFLIHRSQYKEHSAPCYADTWAEINKAFSKKTSLLAHLLYLTIVEEKRGRSNGRVKIHKKKTQIIVLNYLYMIVED